MTAISRVTLKGVFENGDVPTQSDYENLIDSSLNLVDTTAQSMAGPLSTTVLTAPEVSAGDVNATGRVSASAMNVLGVVSAASMVMSGVVSAAGAGVQTLLVTVSASIGELLCTSLRVNTSITAAATIGAGEEIPASVAGYALININGTSYRIPLFLAD
jgi:hypothetical protein